MHRAPRCSARATGASPPVPFGVPARRRRTARRLASSPSRCASALGLPLPLLAPVVLFALWTIPYRIITKGSACLLTFRNPVASPAVQVFGGQLLCPPHCSR